MKVKLLIGILLALLISKTSSAQQSLEVAQSLDETGTGNVNLNAPGMGGAAFQITGTWTGTDTFEGSLDCLFATSPTYVSINVYPPNSAVAQTTTTANGIFQASTIGLACVRVRVTTPGTGTANVRIRSSTSSAKGGGAGGGGGGAPTTATYLLQTSNASLPSAQNMSALATGIVKNTTATGVQSIAVAADLPGGPYCATAGCTMTGAILYPNGTAAAPAISFSGDTTTGIGRQAGGYTQIVSSANGQQLHLVFTVGGVATGDVSLGTSGSNNFQSNGTINPNVDNTLNLGFNTLRWNTGFITQIQLGNQASVLNSTANKLVGVLDGASATGMELNMGTPTLGTCTGGVLTSGSHNFGGEVTGNTSGSCIINFGVPNFTNTPFCTINDESALIAVQISARSPSSMTVTGAASGNNFQWLCLGRIGT